MRLGGGWAAFDALKEMFDRQASLAKERADADSVTIRDLVHSVMQMAGKLTAYEAAEARVAMNPAAAASSVAAGIVGPAGERIKELETEVAILEAEKNALLLANDDITRDSRSAIEAMQRGAFEIEGPAA